MHELSIAMSIAELAVEEAHKHHASTVIRVDVEIGTLSGVETEALEFAWDAAIQGTAAEKASLRIISVPAEALCLDCRQSFPVGQLFAQCPNCSGFRYELVKGRELSIKSLEIE
jgi:hydrogenase nickel incorporation protein HypA/HybF